MRFLSGLLALLLALAISGVAAFFSVTGLAALFAAAFWPVVIMGGTLEAGKLVAATWLHANWRNPRVTFLHKAYLSAAVAALMVITAIGIYGYLSAGYLEQTAPIGEVTIQIEQREAQIVAKREQVARLNDRQAQLDAAVNSLIQQQHVLASQKLRDSQKAERGQLTQDLTAANADISRLAAEIVPLKSQSSEVSAKLGPVKYVAALFGWQNPDSAVRMVILVVMFAFDPLAITLVLSSTISFEGWAEERRKKAQERQAGEQSEEQTEERPQTPQSALHPKSLRHRGLTYRLPRDGALVTPAASGTWTTMTTTTLTSPAPQAPQNAPESAPQPDTAEAQADAALLDPLARSAAWGAFLASMNADATVAEAATPEPAHPEPAHPEPAQVEPVADAPSASEPASEAIAGTISAVSETPATGEANAARGKGWLD